MTSQHETGSAVAAENASRERIKSGEDKICNRLRELTEQSVIKWQFIYYGGATRPTTCANYNGITFEIPWPTEVE